jgi:hypothetical protein
VLSELTLEELASAPEAVRRVLDAVPDANIELVNVSEEARALASVYIEARAVGPGSEVDALHIVATLARVEVLASWNFRHIVNLSRIRAYNAVNLRAPDRLGRSSRTGALAEAEGNRPRSTRRGSLTMADVHWYEAHGIGRKRLKVKRFLG